MYLRHLSCLVALAGCAVVAAACSDVEPEAPPAHTATAPALATAAEKPTPEAPLPPSIEGCEPKAPPAGQGPVGDSSGPYYHQVVVAHTVDGLALADDAQVLDHASVPDGVQLANGDVYIYYVNGEQHGVFVARLDGDVPTVLGPVVISGVERPDGVVDPDATLLADGTIRLTYFGTFGPPDASHSYVMCIADSSDGINFTVRGKAIEFDEITTDPSITQLGDGSWLMAVSQGQASVLARSADGIRFTEYASVDYGGVPEVTTLDGGDVRLYVCAREGLRVYRSPDDGQSWEHEGTLNRPPGRGMLMCDPSVVSGTDLFIYKTAE